MANSGWLPWVAGAGIAALVTAWIVNASAKRAEPPPPTTDTVVRNQSEVRLQFLPLPGQLPPSAAQLQLLLQQALDRYDVRIDPGGLLRPPASPTSPEGILEYVMLVTTSGGRDVRLPREILPGIRIVS